VVLRVFLITLLFVQSATARPRYDEHLLPEDSVYTDVGLRGVDPYYDFYKDYEENVVRVLFDAFDDTVVARVVVYPSFQPEYVVGLVLNDKKYELLHLEPSVQLYQFEGLEVMKACGYKPMDDPDGSKHAASIREVEDHLPPSREDVAVERCERNISEAIGAKLYNLWGEMLFRTRYPDLRPVDPNSKARMINLGIDGTRYHFSFEYPGIVLAGNIWSPRPESNTGQFVSITSLMKEACHATDNDKILTEIERRVDDLMTTLAETVY
jgi:hypothetical protein